MRPRELYRDPVYDGATDPTVVIAHDGWWMFYTQRRATHPDPGPGVSWVHGSRIGVARSPEGLVWTYAGTLEPDTAGLALDAAGPPAVVDATHWAPDVVHDGTAWRMYLTEIDGIPDRWPGHARHIVEYTSPDLRRWTRVGPLTLVSDRVIDAAVTVCPDGLWRLWYKDEAADSVTKVAVSADLRAWRDAGTAVGGRPHEGPYVFPLGGRWWMITDEWRGLAVHSSLDAVSWQRQGGPDDVVLEGFDGVPRAHHGAAVRDGANVWFYWFGHPLAAVDRGAEGEGVDERRSAVYRSLLTVDEGMLQATVIESSQSHGS